MVYIIISSIIIKSVPSKRSNCYIIQVNYCHLGMWALLSVFPIFLRSHKSRLLCELSQFFQSWLTLMLFRDFTR